MIQKELIGDLKLKWDHMQQAMQKINAGGCLLTVDVNLYYTTGRIYSGYFYLPAEGAPWFFVKRPNGLTGDHVEYIRKPEQMAELFASHGLEMPEKLLLEADELTYNDYIRLQKIFNPKETGNATAMMRELRRIKTPYEIEMFRISAERHAKTYAEIPECFRPGMTDLEFQYEIEKRMRKNGSIGHFQGGFCICQQNCFVIKHSAHVAINAYVSLFTFGQILTEAFRDIYNAIYLLVLKQ